ncbi:MAG: MmcB family DNA repair protein [Candidatus Omnitrophica bacterium]|nr:MmcB family DNA repair protein [Candidatus Omnitrophota bacterium]
MNKADFKLSALDIELAVVEFFNPRQNLIVPNVWWSYFKHECDLLVLTKSNYAYEIEIKTTLSDLKKDLLKKHGHYDHKIKRLYFAIPESLEKHIVHIPERAGVLAVKPRQGRTFSGEKIIYTHLSVLRKAKDTSKYKFSNEDRYNLARLGTMRVWKLKQKLQGGKNV